MGCQIDNHFEALYAEKIGWDRFYHETRAYWFQVAQGIIEYWGLSDHAAVISKDDVVQELLMHTWKALEKYDPTRGTSLSGFVLFVARSRTMRWVHEQRGAADDKGNRQFSGKNQSKAPIAAGDLVQQRGDIDSAFQAIESIIDTIKLARNRDERRALNAVMTEGNITNAALKLGRKRAKYKVRKTMLTLAERRENLNV